jgi:two-component system OmpR family response regulator
MKGRLLIVDDEVSLCEMLADAFTLAGYSVSVAHDGYQAIRVLKSQKIDLLIVDVNMPKMNGFEFIERIRAIPDETPAIMLSARTDRPDVNMALRAGADDYVMKPFGLEELSLRVAAVLRRTLGATVAKTTLHCGPIELDEEQHTVKLNSELVDLSPTEFNLLRALLKRQGKLVSKASLLDQVWNIGFSADATVVSTYISYLRRKLHTEEWQGISTVRGLGFQINAEPLIKK